MDKNVEIEMEAAVFRSLRTHLQNRTDVQNIDMMNLTGFCRNCLSRWYKEAAQELGIDISKEESKEIVYGMPASEWKQKYQTEATGQQKSMFNNSKQVRDTRVGDTITHEKQGTTIALPGFQPSQPVVFCGLFPVDNSEFEDLRESIEKLALNDASFSFEMETSAALGFGFRCGFLGLLHLEVVRDRIEREYGIELITTAPSVIYHIHMKDQSVIELHNPADMPDLTYVDHIEEPRIKATILVPDDYLGDVLKLCQDRRGIQLDLTYAGSRAMVVYDLPLNEVVFDFYDRLKSVTKGYASFDYQLENYRQDFLVKMQIMVNDEPVDALSTMVHRDRAESRGRAMCEKLKDLIPRHNQ